jgi:hypothetical protein
MLKKLPCPMMKLISFLILLFPLTLFGQKDSAQHSLKEKQPFASINGKTKGGILKADLFKAGKLTLMGEGTKGCRVEGFSMAIHYKWKNSCDTIAPPAPMRSSSDKLTQKMINALKADLGYSGCYRISVTFFNIIWGSPDRTLHKVDDISFTLWEK